MRNADWIGEISLQIFNLDMVSPMYRDPAKFGIARVLDDPRDLGPGEHPRDDLARYLEHESASGMSPAEVRDAFNSVLGAATDALPALRGDNFLYYRYKSHIFLYLCRDGIDVFRSEHHAPGTVHGTTLSSAELPAAVALGTDVTLTRTDHPYADVAARLDRAWSDPTPLGGPARSHSFVRSDATPVRPRRSALVHRGQQHRLFELGAEAADVLETAVRSGTRSALDMHGEQHRGRVAALLGRALDEGLLVGKADIAPS